MNKTVKWILAGTGTLALAAAVYAIPAFAAGNRSGMMGSQSESGYGMMSGNAGTGMMSGGGGMMAGTDMSTMHNAMAPLMSQMSGIHTQVMGDIAKLFGMTTEELNNATAGGKSLADLAAEKKVGIGEVRAVMTRSMKALLDQAVQQGSITAEQEGQMLGYMEKNMDQCLTGQMGSMMGGSTTGGSMMGSNPGI